MLCIASRRRHISRRTLALFAGLFLTLSLLLSTAYIAREAHHDCTGHNCPVCACILQCENTLRRLGSALLPVLTAAVLAVLLLYAAPHTSLLLPAVTPVARHIRLNR